MAEDEKKVRYGESIKYIAKYNTKIKMVYTHIRCSDRQIQNIGVNISRINRKMQVKSINKQTESSAEEMYERPHTAVYGRPQAQGKAISKLKRIIWPYKLPAQTHSPRPKVTVRHRHTVAVIFFLRQHRVCL